MPLQFDDIPDASQPASQAAPQAPMQFDDIPQSSPQSASAPMDFDSLPDHSQQQAPIQDPSMLGAAARGALREAAPTTGAVVSGSVAASAAESALQGAKVGVRAGPYGAIAGGLAGGLAGGYLASKGQDWVMDKLGLRNASGTLTSAFNPAQEQADVQQHPYATEIGSLLDTLLSLGTGSGQAIPALQRALSGGIMGAGEAGQELYNDGGVNPGKVILAAGAGAAAPVPREWVAGLGGKVAGATTRLKGTGTGAIQNPVATEPGTPPSDIEVDPQQAKADQSRHSVSATSDAAGTSTPKPAPITDATAVQSVGTPVGAAMQARVAAKPSDPERNLGKGSLAQAKVVETPPSQPNISVGDVDPTVSAALGNAAPPAATAAPPAPPINTGLGATDEGIPPFLQRNPDGSFKNQPQAAPAQPVAPARAARNAAIQQELQPQQAVPQLEPKPAATVETPPVPLHPKIADMIDTSPFLQAATEHAMQRPIEVRPMPSGANSSKDITGPVYVDPSIPEQFRRPLAVHETVEQLLMAQGMKYPDAHEIATAAEHAAVVRSGLDWNEYTKSIDGHLAATEHTHPTDLPTDLHVNPEAADNAQTHHLGKDEIIQKLTNTPEVTAPVTPAIPPGRLPKVVRNALSFLRDNNMSDRAERLQNAPPDLQIQVAEAMERKLRGATGRRPMVNGKIANTPELATKRQQAIDAIQQAVAAHPNDNPDLMPVSVPDKQNLIGRLQKMVDTATAANGGADPVKTYKRTDDPAWRLMRAAQRVIAPKGATPKNIKDYIAAEALVRNGGGADVQATDRIEGDIAHKGEGPDNLAAEVPQSRPAFEPFTNEGQQESQVYTDQQNELRDWLRELDDPTFQDLYNKHPDIELDVNSTQDPGALLQAYKDDIGERVSPSETPGVQVPLAAGQMRKAGKPPQEKIADFTAAGAASPGRSLKGTPEFEKLAAQYQTAPGTLKGVQDAAKKFLGNNEGAVRNLLPYLFPKSRNPIADRAAEDLAHSFNVNDGKLVNLDSKLGANFAAGHPQLNDPEWLKTYRDLERKIPLGPKEQAVYDQYVEPLRQERDHVAKLAKRLGFKLPDDYNGNVANIPRVRVPDEKAALNDMPWAKGLSSWDGALQDRVFFALDDNAGQRLIFSMDDDGNPVIIRNGVPTVLKNVPAGFEGKLGDTLPLKVSGKQGTFKVDEATANEITTATNGKVKFVEHPLIAYANSIRGMRAAILRDTMLKRIQANQTVKDFSTTDAEKARTLGYQETQLKQLQKDAKGKTIYYDPRLQQLFDDFRRPGLNEDALQTLRNFAQDMAKPLYILSPTFHILNIAAQHFIGTAALMAREPGKAGSALLHLIPDLAVAYKDVLTQGPIQREMRRAGGRTMYSSQVYDGGVIQDMMQKAGVNISQRPGLWTGLAKATGIPVDQWGHNLMRGSNKITWAGNDILQTALYMTAKRLGMNLTDAANAVGNYIGRYRATDSPTFMNSRWAQKILNDPAFSWFGPYHQDLWNSVFRTAKNIATPQNAADWREAVGATAALALLTYGIYPYILDPFAKMITGNRDATMGRRGAAALAQIPGELYEGEPNAYTQAGTNLFTPSIPFNTIWEATHNLDWKGQHVLTPGAPALTQAAQGADYAARALVPPYAQAAAMARQQGVTVGSVLKKMLESGVGLKEPSNAAAKYQALQAKHNATELHEREKHPEGFLEKFLNR